MRDLKVTCDSDRRDFLVATFYENSISLQMKRWDGELEIIDLDYDKAKGLAAWLVEAADKLTADEDGLEVI